MDVLKVAEGGLATRAPVDECFPAIGELRVPEALERCSHRASAPLVHGEALSSPVGADAEAPMLAADVVARLIDEAPHPLEVALAAQRRAGFPFAGDDLVQHELRRDPRVVHPRQPERVVTEHAVVTDEGVLDRGRQGMTDVQRARDVRRWLGDHELPGAWRCLLRRRERAALEPALVDPGLDGGSVVARGELAVRRRNRHCRSPLHAPGTKNPLVEGRAGASWYHLRSTLKLSVLVSALSGGARPARVRPSPSRARWALSPFGPPSLQADGGVLLTVVAVSGV